MQSPALSRRELMRGSVALAAYALASRPLSAFGLEARDGEQLIPFLDRQPTGRAMLMWENLTSWITPNPDVYEVKHYNVPTVDPAKWRLDITGYVKSARTLTLADLKARKRKSVTATLECGGNGASVGFMGAVANVRWTGTPLAPILRECGLMKRAEEAVFYGSDDKVEKIRDADYPQNFARSLTVEHALRNEVILAYEMNGEPLPAKHGSPVRLVVPGWFGIAWVKWLRRIDLLDRRFMGKWMAREYVTIRGEEGEGGWTNWRETSVCNLCVKSIAARAVRRPDGSIRITGAAWSDGTPLTRVDLKIDEGSWQPCVLERKPSDAKFTWSFWHYDWRNPPAGEHSVVSRAADADGREQPPPDDSTIKNKKTYWEANQQWPRKLKV